MTTLTPSLIDEIRERDLADLKRYAAGIDVARSAADRNALLRHIDALAEERKAIVERTLVILDEAKSIYREGSNSDARWEIRKAALLATLRGES